MGIERSYPHPGCTPDPARTTDSYAAPSSNNNPRPFVGMFPNPKFHYRNHRQQKPDAPVPGLVTRAEWFSPSEPATSNSMVPGPRPPHLMSSVLPSSTAKTKLPHIPALKTRGNRALNLTRFFLFLAEVRTADNSRPASLGRTLSTTAAGKGWARTRG